MFIAKVVGNVWATTKHSSLEGKKLMLVRPVHEMNLAPCGDIQMALDVHIGAGIGDIVLIIDEGNACRKILGYREGPTRTIISGVIDSVYRKNRRKKFH